MEDKVNLATQLKEKPADESKLRFGEIFTDHMLLIDYDTNRGWHNARIVAYGYLRLDPAAACLHYGQEIFEGLKAYYGKDGGIYLFRPVDNFKRLNYCKNEFYRASTRDKAIRIGVTSWVKNLPGGDVEAVFLGEKNKVMQMIEWCKKGPTY